MDNRFDDCNRDSCSRSKAKELSQEKFAFEGEIHRTYVSDVESGRRNPTVTVVEKFAKTLGVTHGSLLDADFDESQVRKFLVPRLWACIGQPKGSRAPELCIETRDKQWIEG